MPTTASSLFTSVSNSNPAIRRSVGGTFARLGGHPAVSEMISLSVHGDKDCSEVSQGSRIAAAASLRRRLVGRNCKQSCATRLAADGIAPLLIRSVCCCSPRQRGVDLRLLSARIHCRIAHRSSMRNVRGRGSALASNGIDERSATGRGHRLHRYLATGRSRRSAKERFVIPALDVVACARCRGRLRVALDEASLVPADPATRSTRESLASLTRSVPTLATRRGLRAAQDGQEFDVAP